MTLLQYIRKPYPLSTRKWPLILIISAFISLFMPVFQPFGLQFFEAENKTLLLAGYGLVTFLVLIINLLILPLLFPRLFKEEQWSILKQVLWLSWIISTISAGNYMYSTRASITNWIGINGFLVFLGFTFLIAIFPITGITIVNHNRLLKRNLKYSSSMNDSMGQRKQTSAGNDQAINISSDSGNQEIEMRISDLLYIESDGNYLEIGREQAGSVKHEILRSTLKRIETQLPESDWLFKCHRAYIINLQQIEKVKGNSQGYRAVMKSGGKEIPVARGYSKAFREAIERLT